MKGATTCAVTPYEDLVELRGAELEGSDAFTSTDEEIIPLPASRRGANRLCASAAAVAVDGPETPRQPTRPMSDAPAIAEPPNASPEGVQATPGASCSPQETDSVDHPSVATDRARTRRAQR
jgi:hypothetical protein